MKGIQLLGVTQKLTIATDLLLLPCISRNAQAAPAGTELMLRAVRDQPVSLVNGTMKQNSNPSTERWV